MLAGVAEEPQPRPFADRSTCLGDVGAVEAHRVAAVLAVDRVAAVAGIPDERVVAVAHNGGVVAAVAVDRVVAVAAVHRLGAVAADQVVIPVAAAQRRRPAPPVSVSLPSPPSIVVGIGVGEDAVALVDAHDVVAVAASTLDRRDLGARRSSRRPCRRRRSRPGHARLAGLQPNGDPVAAVRALDREHAVLAERSAPWACRLAAAPGSGRRCRRRRRRSDAARRAVERALDSMSCSWPRFLSVSLTLVALRDTGAGWSIPAAVDGFSSGNGNGRAGVGTERDELLRPTSIVQARRRARRFGVTFGLPCR